MNLLNKIIAIAGVVCITCLVAVSQDNRTVSVQPIINAASLGQATNVFIGSSTGLGITTNTAGSVYTPFLRQVLTDYNGNSWTNNGFMWQQSSGGSQSPLQPLIGDPLFVSPYRIHVTDYITTTNMLTIRNLYLGWTSDARIDGYVSAGGVGFYGGGLNITNVAASNIIAGGTLSATVMPAHTGDITTPSGSVATTLKSTGTAGTYRSVTFDAQGRETSGSNPTTFSGYGISDTSANLAAAITDETGTGVAVFGTAPTFTTSITTPTVYYTTNNNPVIPDFTLAYQLFQTNAAFTFLAPAGVDTTKKFVQTTCVFVTNSTAAAVAVTAPANVHTQGTWFLTNVTAFSFTCYASQFTNAIAYPLW